MVLTFCFFRWALPVITVVSSAPSHFFLSFSIKKERGEINSLIIKISAFFGKDLNVRRPSFGHLFFLPDCKGVKARGHFSRFDLP
jgi:hypothetical protein